MKALISSHRNDKPKIRGKVWRDIWKFSDELFSNQRSLLRSGGVGILLPTFLKLLTNNCLFVFFLIFISENMDDLLEYCFFCALLRMKKVELPVLTSTFFRSYLLPSRLVLRGYSHKFWPLTVSSSNSSVQRSYSWYIFHVKLPNDKNVIKYQYSVPCLVKL